MPQNPLETYLQELENGLRSLPLSEREQELTEAKQHLEALVAARREAGEDMEAAAEEAIRQFGTARENGTRLREAERRGRLKNLPPLVLAGLYTLAVSTVFGLFEFGIGVIIMSLIYSLKNLWIPQNTLNPLTHSHLMIGPSLVLGLVALVFLFAHQGVRGSIHGAFSRVTSAGTAVLYTLMSGATGFLLWMPLVLLTEPSVLHGWLNASFFVPTLIAGLYTGIRAEGTPRATTSAVAVAALIGPVLGLLKLPMHTAAFIDLPNYLPQFLEMSLPQYVCVPIALLAVQGGIMLRRRGGNQIAKV